QTISFGPLDEMSYGDGPVALQATASSGLPVSFTVVSGPAMLSGTELFITGAGLVTVRASQSGNADYRHAPDVDQSFQVDQAMLSVVGDDATRLYGVTNPPLTGEVDGLMEGDNIVITWTSAASPSSHVGGFAVTPIFFDPNGRLGNY